MKKRILIAGLILILLLSVFPAFAASGEARVFDDAGLFSDEEETSLQNSVETLQQTTGMDVVIVTTNDAQGKTAMAYADDYYDYNGFSDNGVLYLIDMDNREMWISTKGKMIRYLSDSRIDSILDDCAGYVGNEQYAESARAFLSDVDSYYAQGIPSENEGAKGYSIGIGTILFGAVIGILVALFTGLGIRRNYTLKGSTYSYDYMGKSMVNITNASDTYLRSSVVRTRKNEDNGSGGSSTHVSSSGSTHGGGGRSF